MKMVNVVKYLLLPLDRWTNANRNVKIQLDVELSLMEQEITSALVLPWQQLLSLVVLTHATQWQVIIPAFTVLEKDLHYYGSKFMVLNFHMPCTQFNTV